MKTRLFLCGLAACLILLLAGFVQIKHDPVPQQSSKEQFTCYKPGNLHSYPNPTSYYTHVTWGAVSGASSYTFICYYSYFTQGSYMYLVDSFTTTSTSAVINTDLPGYYDWQVRTNCSDNTSSPYAYTYFYLDFWWLNASLPSARNNLHINAK